MLPFRQVKEPLTKKKTEELRMTIELLEKLAKPSNEILLRVYPTIRLAWENGQTSTPPFVNFHMQK